MASNQNFDGSGFLFGSSLVGANGFLKSHGVYLGSAFGTSTPRHVRSLLSNSYFSIWKFELFLSNCINCYIAYIKIHSKTDSPAV